MQRTSEWNGDTVFATVADALAWRDAAIADGWVATPIYKGDSLNDGAVRLERDGWVCQVWTRDLAAKAPDRFPNAKPERKINCWDPRGVAIDVPLTYSFAVIQAGQRACPECGAIDVETFRVAFANRACRDCMPALRAKLERGNWTE